MTPKKAKDNQEERPPGEPSEPAAPPAEEDEPASPDQPAPDQGNMREPVTDAPPVPGVPTPEPVEGSDPELMQQHNPTAMDTDPDAVTDDQVQTPEGLPESSFQADPNDKGGEQGLTAGHPGE
jgi:hypothetical protein